MTATAPQAHPQAHPQALVISIKEAAQRVCISQAEVYRKIKAGTFPQPIKLTERRRGIRIEDLEQWVRSRDTVMPDPADHFKGAAAA